jgi:hypothetical protein
MFANTSERGFQKFIANYLVNEHKYVVSTPQEFDREFCLNIKQVLAFIEATQNEVYELIQKKGERAFLVRLR